MEEWEEPLHLGSLPPTYPTFSPQRNPNCTFFPTILSRRSQNRRNTCLRADFRGHRTDRCRRSCFLQLAMHTRRGATAACRYDHVMRSPRGMDRVRAGTRIGHACGPSRRQLSPRSRSRPRSRAAARAPRPARAPTPPGSSPARRRCMWARSCAPAPPSRRTRSPPGSAHPPDRPLPPSARRAADARQPDARLQPATSRRGSARTRGCS